MYFTFHCAHYKVKMSGEHLVILCLQHKGPNNLQYKEMQMYDLMSKKTGNACNLEWLCLTILNQVSCQSEETCSKCSRWGQLLSESPAENPLETEVMETWEPQLRTPEVNGNRDTCSESRPHSWDILVYMNSMASDWWRHSCQYISTDLMAHAQNLTQQKHELFFIQIILQCSR